MPHLTPQAHRLLASQHGVASIEQLVECGVARHDIRRIQQETGFTAIYVTHDQEEALEISDRLVLMDLGRIVATGVPDEVRAHPFLRAEPDA